MFSIHGEFLKLDVAEDKSGHQAVAPPETLGTGSPQTGVSGACRLDREFTEPAPSKEMLGGTSSNQRAFPVFWQWNHRAFWLRLGCGFCSFCWILPR